MRRLLILVGAGACTVAASQLASARPPLAPGKVEVAVSPPIGITWNPQARIPVRIVVTGRLRPNQRAGQKAFVRYSTGRRPCGPSAARGRGTSVGPFTITRPTKDGYFTVASIKPLTYPRPERVRFCVWIAPRAATRIAPQARDIAFHDGLFAAAITGTGAYDNGSNILTWKVVSTASFTTTTTETSGCQGAVDPPRTRTTSHPRAYMGFAFDGGGFAASGPSCIAERTHSYRLNGGLVEGLDQGGFTFTLAEARMNPPAITAIGSGCALNSDLAASVGETERYIRAVGCTPGRVIRRRSSSAPAGRVIDYEIHGIDGELAARGTTIDIVVSDPAAPASE